MASRTFVAIGLLFGVSGVVLAQNRISDTYTKYEYFIPMRDGKKLCTEVYVPKGADGHSPILMERTPYSAGPYGTAMKGGFRGSQKFIDSKYIFAFQDVRGKYMSEGEFENLRPQLLKTWGQDGLKNDPQSVDESTDTYDTVDYLVKHVPGNNGRVGLWGISYPGGYAALGAMCGHPALRASSPQAPTSDWFLGDDMHHNGAFFLQDYVSFFSGFGGVRPEPSAQLQRAASFNINGDAYKFFLDLGGLSNVDPQIFQGKVPYWADIVKHDTYDDYWQARSVPSGLHTVGNCALLWVGGFYDAEDCWGPQNCFKSTAALSPKAKNYICIGPWYHGMWASRNGTTFHDQNWGSNTSQYFQDNVEFPFFDAFLRGTGSWNGAKATVFDSGSHEWKTYDSWPPKTTKPMSLYLSADGMVSMNKPTAGTKSYVSDPANPVPYEGGTLTGRTRSYMLADQRFADDRSDVLTFRSAPLTENVTLAGPVLPELFAKVSGTDCDFVVKVIDKFPSGAGDLGDYEMLIRGEVMRAKFRNSFQNPSPLDPSKVERVSFTAPDIFHTFLKGHRIEIQVQSSWFPLVDRNPQTFMNIFTAKNTDFQKATINLSCGGDSASRVQVFRRM